MAVDPQRSPGFLAVFRAVFWSFLGVRRGDHYRQDLASLKPHHVIIAGVVAAAVLVIGLVALAIFIVGR